MEEMVINSNSSLGNLPVLTEQEKYQISSDFFIGRWTAEDLEGGDDEYVSWAGEIQIKHKLISALQKLETIEYVS
jgi:hypothetical protein